MDSVPYEEPSHSTLLVLASFVLLVNGARVLFDAISHIGILGELAIGVIYGAPLAGWIERDVQAALIELGYLGLLAIVFHGALLRM
jgi:hypothetical protein